MPFLDYSDKTPPHPPHPPPKRTGTAILSMSSWWSSAGCNLVALLGQSCCLVPLAWPCRSWGEMCSLCFWASSAASDLGSQHGKWMQGELERLNPVVLEGQQLIDSYTCRNCVLRQWAFSSGQQKLTASAVLVHKWAPFIVSILTATRVGLGFPKYLCILIKLAHDFQGDLSQGFISCYPWWGITGNRHQFTSVGEKKPNHRDWIFRWAGFQFFKCRTLKEA